MEYRSHRGSLTFGRYSDANIYSRERLAILSDHLGKRALVGRDRRTLRRLHSWQCCTAIAMLPRPRSVRDGARFLVTGSPTILYSLCEYCSSLSPPEDAGTFGGASRNPTYNLAVKSVDRDDAATDRLVDRASGRTMGTEARKSEHEDADAYDLEPLLDSDYQHVGHVHRGVIGSVRSAEHLHTD